MKLRLKNPRYFPFKVEKGFIIHKTVQPAKSLNFATYKTKKVAIAMGKIWYGPYLKDKCKVCGGKR